MMRAAGQPHLTEIGMIASKVLGLLTVMALITAPLATGAIAAGHSQATSARATSAQVSSAKRTAGLDERAGGCHAHSRGTFPHPTTPPSPSQDSPVPGSHQCCLTGHDAAVVQAPPSAEPPDQSAAVTLKSEPPPRECAFPGLEISAVPSAGPPLRTPLRI
jgi:hypothetical protein